MNRLRAIWKNLDINVFYTDGSQGRRADGTLQNLAAFCKLTRFGVEKGFRMNLGTRVEIANAEVIAICKALEQDGKSTDHKATYVFVDSQAALRQIGKGVDEISQKIWRMTKDKQIYLHWCPSHVNIPGNEMVDRLAKDDLDLEVNEKFKTDTTHSHLKKTNQKSSDGRLEGKMVQRSRS